MSGSEPDDSGDAIGDTDTGAGTEPDETDTEAATSPEATDATGDETATDASDAGSIDETNGTGLLEIEGLDAGYEDLQVLDEVDLAVADGEYVTIVGPNGAGKSTVMKSVFGLTTYMGGRVTFAGEDISGLPPEEVIHEGISYVPQTENVFASLSVRENLEMGAYILDSVPEERLNDVFERFPILDERQSQRAGTLSGGQRQMLAMGRALMLDPDLLMLDEPSAGLAPDLVEEMFDRVDAINEAGTAVLVVEQNAKEALRRCDRGYVLVQGANRFTDTGDALLGNEQVRREFLGG